MIQPKDNGQPGQKNVLGGPLTPCSIDPVTGYFRDGCCHTDETDTGCHAVCCIMTEEFLAYSKSVGNDLSTPAPQFLFPGLKPGDRWCLCAPRWAQAWREGTAPLVILEATHEAALNYASLSTLQEHAYLPDATEP